MLMACCRMNRPSQTVAETVQIVLPSHTQHHNTAFGGQIMEWMVECAMISGLSSVPVLLAYSHNSCIARTSAAYRICPQGTPRLAGIDGAFSM